MLAAPYPEIIKSPLSQSVELGVTRLTVNIYRLATKQGWSLEVVDERGISILWSDLFASDEDASTAFHDTLAREGISAFININATM